MGFIPRVSPNGAEERETARDSVGGEAGREDFTWIAEASSLELCSHKAASTLHYPFYTSLCTGELNAIRMQKLLSLQSFLRKGVSLGYVGLN